MIFGKKVTLIYTRILVMNFTVIYIKFQIMYCKSKLLLNLIRVRQFDLYSCTIGRVTIYCGEQAERNVHFLRFWT